MLKIDHITKIFEPVSQKYELPKTVLDDINLTVEDGEFVTIIGGNGSGKTTLLNILSGALMPTSGHIIVDGEDLTKLKEHKRAKYIGRVFQDPKMGTAGEMSILENLEIAYRRGKNHTLKWGFNKAHKAEFIDVLKKFNLGLEERLTAKTKNLSGGQRQALTLVMAQLQKPKFLLLDEHTAALDPKTSASVLKMTNEIVTENKLTTLMITHNMRDALLYGDRLIMLHNGHILMDVRGDKKKKLTIEDLLKKFEDAAISIGI